MKYKAMISNKFYNKIYYLEADQWASADIIMNLLLETDSSIHEVSEIDMKDRNSENPKDFIYTVTAIELLENQDEEIEGKIEFIDIENK